MVGFTTSFGQILVRVWLGRLIRECNRINNVLFHKWIRFSTHLRTDCGGKKLICIVINTFSPENLSVFQGHPWKTLQCRTLCKAVSCRFMIVFLSICSELNHSRSSKLHPFSPATNNVDGMFWVSQLISAEIFPKLLQCTF